MKKVLIVFVITLIAISCKQATTKNTPENTEPICEGNFNPKTFNHILQQLDLKCEDCYLRFVSEKPVPVNKNLSIWVVPKMTFYEKDDYNNESFNLDSYVLLANTKTGEIVSKYYNANEWSSDAYQLMSIYIDTLDNRLSDDKIIFGISWSYKASTNVCPTGDAFMKLFAQQGDSLHSVFGYSEYEYHGENDGGSQGNSWLGTYNTDLHVTKDKTNSFFDFVLLTDYRLQVTEEDEYVLDRISTDSLRFLSYSGDSYKEIKNHEKTFCRPLEFGKKDCYYYGKSMAEVYQIIFDENIENKQELMLPLLSEKDSCYRRIDNYNDSVSIYYNYEDNNYLGISFATEYGCAYYTFEEKENYTNFKYDYHD